MIIKAAIYDVKKLTDIALKSKFFWGYSNEQIEDWREDLTITSKMFDEYHIYKYLVKDKIVGFYVLERTTVDKSCLHFLFILPEYIKQGVGSKLLMHAIKYCRKENCTALSLFADPNSEMFYAKHGFKKVSKKESSIKGRFLPEMELVFLKNS